MKKELSISECDFKLLSEEELQSTNGGFVQVLLSVGGVVGCLFALSYGAGALYGIVEKQLK